MNGEEYDDRVCRGIRSKILQSDERVTSIGSRRVMITTSDDKASTSSSRSRALSDVSPSRLQLSLSPKQTIRPVLGGAFRIGQVPGFRGRSRDGRGDDREREKVVPDASLRFPRRDVREGAV